MRIMRTLTIFTAFIVLITGYTNCSDTKFNSKSSASTSATTPQNNGDYYTGKPSFYSHFANLKCTTLGKNGQPLPNRQIFLQSGVFHLVRENCADLPASQAIPLSQLTVAADQSSVIYQGQSFALDTNFVNYDLMNTRCPAGLNTYNNAAANLYVDPYNFTTPNWTSFHPMMRPVLDGAIGAMPRYLLEVTSNDPADWFDWKRTSQGVNLEPSTQYAVRFIVRPGTRSEASLHYYDGIDGWTMNINMITGALVVRTTNGPTPTGVNEPYIYGAPGSRIVTVFFTTNAGTTGSDLGISPQGTDALGSVQKGFSIYATAADLRKVSDYCSP